jgi:hypothetical protein
MIAGLIFIGLGCWGAWGEWVTLSRWPRTDAVLISKEISEVSANLVFKYEAHGQLFTGTASRYGSEQNNRNHLASCKPGSTQQVSYDPNNPSDIELVLPFPWDLFMPPISACLIGVLFIAGGVIVYRWSDSRFE